MSTRWAKSADKHGIDRADALNAMRSASIYLIGYDQARIKGGSTVDLFIGPTRDSTHMLEVLAHVDQSERDVLIFHVMHLRRSTVERANQIIRARKERRND